MTTSVTKVLLALAQSGCIIAVGGPSWPRRKVNKPPVSYVRVVVPPNPHHTKGGDTYGRVKDRHLVDCAARP